MSYESYKSYDTEAFPMTRIKTSKARDTFAELIDRARMNGERFVLVRYGKDVAAIVPAGDVELLRAIEDKIDLAAAKKALREKGRNIPHAELKKSEMVSRR